MKFSAEQAEPGIRVTMSGELEVTSCTGLTHFWERRVDGHDRIDIELADVDTGDAHAMATFTALVQATLRGGSHIVLRHPPQVLAHNLYRIGLLDSPRMTLVDVRDEEPYA